MGIENRSAKDIVENTESQKNIDDSTRVERASQKVDWQKRIDTVVSVFKDAKENDEYNDQDIAQAQQWLRNVPSSELFVRSGEDLQALFLSKQNTVDFQGNVGAQRAIGAGNLFPKTKPGDQYIKINGQVAKYGGLRSDGNPGYAAFDGYIAIKGGETIETDVKEREIKRFEKQAEKQNVTFVDISPEDDQARKAEALEDIKQEEASAQELHEAYVKFLEEKGIPAGEVPGDRLFFESAKFLAQEIEKQYGIPWQVTAAQATLESGSGKSGLARKDKNFFGIKDFSGGGRKWRTREVFDGKEVYIKDAFRTYDSFEESFHDYAKLITNRRYGPVIDAYKRGDLKTPRQVLSGIIKAGYATDPEYVAKAESTLNSYGSSLDAGFQRYYGAENVSV